ncbi:hypothetical protein GN958_ATG13939 [Phytophthora infestans]|uniref:Uncharacterized protein n=1 Tax=Phytophthora infestans TaxID=4787 RepID=A0A8S9UCC6_PHYIN|nr:hypothetical protein GN958_ATG13939 [Phytophthora infestans]
MVVEKTPNDEAYRSMYSGGSYLRVLETADDNAVRMEFDTHVCERDEVLHVAYGHHRRAYFKDEPAIPAKRLIDAWPQEHLPGLGDGVDI